MHDTQTKFNCSLLIYSAIFVLLLQGCARSEFTVPASTQDLTLDSKATSISVSNENVADGMTETVVSLVLRNKSMKPLPGLKINLAVSGSGNLVAPCTVSNTNGESWCRLLTTVAETKMFVFSGALEAAMPIVFNPPKPMRSLMAFVSSADLVPVNARSRSVGNAGGWADPAVKKDAQGATRLHVSQSSQTWEREQP